MSAAKTNITDLEAKLANQLDDLLVVNSIEEPRPMVFPDVPKGMMILSIYKKVDPRIQIKLVFFSNETEEPHFKVIYKNCSCRFKIKDCSMMPADCKNQKAIQPIINIKKQIFKMWQDNYTELCELWKETRPTDTNMKHQIIQDQKTK